MMIIGIVILIVTMANIVHTMRMILIIYVNTIDMIITMTFINVSIITYSSIDRPYLTDIPLLFFLPNIWKSNFCFCCRDRLLLVV